MSFIGPKSTQDIVTTQAKLPRPGTPNNTLLPGDVQRSRSIKPFDETRTSISHSRRLIGSLKSVASFCTVCSQLLDSIADGRLIFLFYRGSVRD
jgi:hypothetical protein